MILCMLIFISTFSLVCAAFDLCDKLDAKEAKEKAAGAAATASNGKANNGHGYYMP